MSLDLQVYLQTRRGRVDEALAAVLDEYLLGVNDWLVGPIRYACEGGGKRFRPILFLASYEVAGGTAPARMERLAVSLEIVHAYSLVHDDLPCMDDDAWRRGRATCHRAFGVDRATVAAAAMVPLASWVMGSEARAAGLDPRESAELVAELSRAAGPGGMVGGQMLDLSSEGGQLDATELREIHRRKTGALICAAARLGARAARARSANLQTLSEYGEKIGLAFQIVDDLLDETEPARGSGSADRALGKATYPALVGAGEARATARKLAGEAVERLRAGGLSDAVLESLAVHVVEREH